MNTITSVGEFNLGDKVKVTSDAIIGWDRNPIHEIYAFGVNDDNSLFVCLRTDTPVCGDIETGKRTNSYMTGVFAIGDFKKV
jgi:hypothetical protein